MRCPSTLALLAAAVNVGAFLRLIFHDGMAEAHTIVHASDLAVSLESFLWGKRG